MAEGSRRKPAAIAAEDHAPWKPPHLEPAEIAAIKALAVGAASIHAQKLALNVIIHKICRTYDMSYRPGPDGERDTVFAEGRRSGGLELVKVINMPAAATKKEEREQ